MNITLTLTGASLLACSLEQDATPKTQPALGARYLVTLTKLGTERLAADLRARACWFAGRRWVETTSGLRQDVSSAAADKSFAAGRFHLDAIEVRLGARCGSIPSQFGGDLAAAALFEISRFRVKVCAKNAAIWIRRVDPIATQPNGKEVR